MAFWYFHVDIALGITNKENLENIIESTKLFVKENRINNLLEQLNPHFMFNAINNIRALILKDTEQARDMLTSFADIMRYQININNEALVKLEDELNFVIDYIELNRLQLGSRLHFTKDIEAALLTNFIPRMALQLLVENAIKHGFGHSSSPAMLKIKIDNEASKQNPNAWFISVENSGHIDKNDSTNSGIGLANLEERLKLSFADNYTLTLTEENDVVKCKIHFNY